MKNFVKYFVLFLCVPYFLSSEALRVQPIFNFHFQDSARVFKKNILPLLEKNDIVFVDDNPDVILIFGRPIKDMRSLKYPHILFDETESASICGKIKKNLKNPYTKAIFKNTTLRPKSLYNNTPLKKHHFKIIKNNPSTLRNSKIRSHSKNERRKIRSALLAVRPLSTNEQQKIRSALLAVRPLSTNEQQKIQSVLWDTYRSPFNDALKHLKEHAIDFDAQRPVDVFFAGTINSSSTPGLHRTQLVKKLETIKKINPKKTIISHIGRLPKEEYFDLLKKSKIVISPWGNGEWCWRDYEAIYSGAVVIKPDTSFVHAIPNLYCNDKYYVACKADFSDLHKKISYVLANYQKFTDMRKKARNLLANHWDNEKIAQDLAKAIRQALKK